MMIFEALLFLFLCLTQIHQTVSELCTVKNKENQDVKKYYQSDEKGANWQEANDLCINGTLAIITDAEQAQTFLNCILDDNIEKTLPLWIGMKSPYYHSMTDEFRWSDCSTYNVFAENGFQKQLSTEGGCGLLRTVNATERKLTIEYESCGATNVNIMCQENILTSEEYIDDCFLPTTTERTPPPLETTVNSTSKEPTLPTFSLPPVFRIIPPIINFQEQLTEDAEEHVDEELWIFVESIESGEQQSISRNQIHVAGRCDEHAYFENNCTNTDIDLLNVKDNHLHCGILEHPTNDTVCASMIEFSVTNIEKLREMIPKTSPGPEVDLILPNSPKIVGISFFQRTENSVVNTREISFTTKFSIEDIVKLYRKQYINESIIKTIHAECMFYDNGSLSFSGCKARNLDLTNGHVTCHCSHTTMFAVLLSVKADKVTPQVEIISYVFEIFSVLFLLITLIILLVFRRRIRSDRTPIQINLVVTLLLHHVVLLFGGLARKNNYACITVAVLAHITLLSATSWMLIEGVFLLMKTTKGLSWSDNTRKKLIYILLFSFAWGIPLLIVGGTLITCFVGGKCDYMYENDLHGIVPPEDDIRKYDFCWVSKNNVRLYTVIIPVAIILTLSLIITCKVLHFVHRMSVNTRHMKPGNPKEESLSKLTHFKATVKAFSLLIPIMGIPWILGFFTNLNDDVTSLVFQYIHVIINGMQGFFLFLIYCVFGSEVRAVVSLTMSRITSTFSHLSEGNEYRRKKSNGSHNRTSSDGGNRPSNGH